MRRVLRETTSAGAPRVLIAPSAADDPAVRAVLDQEVAAAYERGRVEGDAAGRAAVQSDVDRVTGALHAAVDQARQLARSVDEAIAARLTDLAVDIAAAIVGELPTEHLNVVNRVHDAINAIDDRPITVHVHPQDEAVVARLAERDVEVVADATLAPGEATVVGRWADADLTWQAVWTAVREALDVA